MTHEPAHLKTRTMKASWFFTKQKCLRDLRPGELVRVWPFYCDQPVTATAIEKHSQHTDCWKVLVMGKIEEFFRYDIFVDKEVPVKSEMINPGRIAKLIAEEIDKDIIDELIRNVSQL